MEKSLFLENRKLSRRRIEGEPDKYNKRQLNRSFFIVLSKDEYEYYSNLGYNTWATKPMADMDSDEEYIPTYYLVVRVSVDSKTPPRVVIVEPTGKYEEDTQGVLRELYNTTLLSVDQYSLADSTEYDYADIKLNNYTNKETGKISHYLESLYLVVPSNRLKNKYGL